MQGPYILAWLSDYIHDKVWDEIVYTFQTSMVQPTIEVWESISIYI